MATSDNMQGGSKSSFPTADSMPSAAAATADAASSAHEATAEAGAAADKLLTRVVQGAHDTIDKLAEKATPHVERIQSGLADAGDTLNEKVDQMKTVSDEWAESLRMTVRDNPLAAVATALAVGMLFARLTR